jgi:radical SAM superfamily enzyme YgiQ (UPF0313 family)
MERPDDRQILLIHPLGYGTEAAQGDISRMANLMPPLGLASIAAVLKKQGMDVTIVDCFSRPDSDRVIRDYVRTKKPALVGLSCTTSSFMDGIRMAGLVKSVFPKTRVVFGGPHVSALKERILDRFAVVDFVVVGEGEETMLQLMEAGQDDPAGVKGLVYREPGGDSRFTGYRSKGIDLDSLPFPAYELLPGYPEAYKLPIFSYPKAPNTSCISSRGCPYTCTYCDRSVFRRSFRFNSAQYLYAHLKYLRSRFGIRHINFYDDQFTFNRERIETFARMMINGPLGMTFNCAVRAEHVDSELLRVLKAAGCWMISVGIETGDPALLAEHRQNPDLSRVAETIRRVKRAGIRTKGLFMMGLPGETELTIRNTMRYAFSLPLDDLNMSKFTPFPGAPIYEKIHELGEFQEDWEKMDCMHFQFIPAGMTEARLEAMFRKFYQTHFMRPKVFLGYLAMLWRSPDSWRRFVRDLGGYFRFIRTDSRLGTAP